MAVVPQRTRALRGALPVLSALVALSCHIDLASSDGSSGGTQDPPAIQLSASADTLIVWRGDSGGTVNVTLARQHYDGMVTLAASTTADGVTASVSPTSLSGSTLSTTLSVGAAKDARGVGFQTAKVTAKGAGVDSQSVLVTLSVRSPSLNVVFSGTGSGRVTADLPGLNCLATCSSTFYAGAAITLTAVPNAGSAFAGWSGACAGSTPTCTLTLGKTLTTPVTAAFTSTAPGVALTVTPPVVSLEQGASGTATVNVARTNFTGAVNLTVSGAPSGLTVTPATTSVTGDAATLTIAAASSLAAGNYPLTVTATGAGITQRTATLTAQVTLKPGGGGGNVVLRFATCDPSQLPLWLAVQNGSGAWTRVTAGANNAYTFPVGASTGVAWAQRDGTNVVTTVLYASGAELATVANGDPCAATPQRGTKQINVTLTNVFTAPSYATLSIGGTDLRAETSGPYTLKNVPSGTRDLLASIRRPINPLTPVQRLVLRRNVNYSDNATIPNVDFLSAESFNPTGRVVDVDNLGADRLSVSESFSTVNGVSVPLYEDVGGILQGTGAPGVNYYGVPDTLLRPGDMHQIEIDAEPQVANPSSQRFAILFVHSPTRQRATLGPTLAAPTVTNVATAPYLRPRAQLRSQSEYGSGLVAFFAHPDGNSVQVWTTAAYFGGTPPSWTLDVPDFTGAGYDPTWGLRSGAPLEWNVNAASGNILPFVGAVPVDGAQVVGANASSPSSTSIVSLRSAVRLRTLGRRF